MRSGQLILHGVEDTDLISILEMKKQHPSLFYLNLQPIQTQLKPDAGEIYNNVIVVWDHVDGLAAIVELLNRLTREQVKSG
jgi:hypothetical protein